MGLVLQPTLFDKKKWFKNNEVYVNRKWATPNKNTFKIAPIEKLLKKY